MHLTSMIVYIRPMMTPNHSKPLPITNSDLAGTGAVLVVGLGDLGGRIAGEAVTLGLPTWGMRRGSEVPNGVRLIQHDASLPWPVPETAVEDVVLCLPPTERSDQGYQQAYRTVAEQALHTLQQYAPQAHVWLISSTSVYAQSRGEWVDENSPAEPTRSTARIIRDTERYWLDSPQATTILRPAGIYGPGRNYLIRQAVAGFQVVDKQPVYTNRIHVVDAARAVVHLLQRRRDGFLPPPVVNLADRCPVSMQELIPWLQQQLGVAPTDHRQLDRGSKRVASQLLADSGFVWAFPSFREGYAELVEQYLRHQP